MRKNRLAVVRRTARFCELRLNNLGDNQMRKLLLLGRFDRRPERRFLDVHSGSANKRS